MFLKMYFNCLEFVLTLFCHFTFTTKFIFVYFVLFSDQVENELNKKLNPLNI